MSGKTGNYILIGMVLGAVLGALGGYFFGDIFIQIKFLGTIFLNALKMIVVPLIVASMIVGVTSLGDIRKLGRTAGKTLLYYLATTGAAVLIGIVLVNIIQPGSGIGYIGNSVPEMVANSEPIGFSDFVVNLIPSNLISAAAEGSVLPLIIFSLVFGGVLTSIGSKGKPVINFFVGLNMAIMKVVILIIYFAPIGILALIGSIVAENRGSLQEIVSGLGLYTLTVIIGLILHGAIILPLILKIFGKKDPFRYFLNMGQALATAFTTASSSATLPVTMEAVTEKNKVSEKASSFVLPLGATINMDGTALYEAVAAIFIAQAINHPLSIDAQIIIFLTATLASIGAAAIPHAGLVTMVMVLSAVGLPLEGIGFIFAVDWFLDRCRTTVNVWGDSVGAAVIGETEEIRGYRIGGEKKPAPEGKKDYPDSGKSPVRKYTPKNQDSRKEYKPSGGPKFGKSRESSYKSKPTTSKYDSKPKTGKDYPKKPYRKNDGDRPIRKKEPVHLSKEAIEKDLERVHQQLTALGTGGAAAEKKDLTNKIDSDPKPKDKPTDSGDEFFEKGLPKFDFFGDKDSGGDKKPKAESKKDEIIELPQSLDNSNIEEVTVSESAPQDKPESDAKPTTSEVNDKKVESPKAETTEEQDFGWGREKKKRPSR